MSLVKQMRPVKLVLALVLTLLLGCRTAPKREGQSRTPQTTFGTADTISSTRALSDDTCGLADFPVSKSTQEILAAVPRDTGRPPNQMMIAKIAVSPEGRITHLRVMRLAWPKLANYEAINKQALDSIKRGHYGPTIVGGKPVAVCSEVGVTVDLE
jgi:hypothetical protein